MTRNERRDIGWDKPAHRIESSHKEFEFYVGRDPELMERLKEGERGDLAKAIAGEYFLATECWMKLKDRCSDTTVMGIIGLILHPLKSKQHPY